MTHLRPAISVTAGDPQIIEPRLWRGFRGVCAYDVGCNVGQNFPRLLHKFGTVHAFEPERRSHYLALEFAELANQQNPQSPNAAGGRRGSGVHVYRLAISDQDADIVLCRMHGTKSDESGQLVTPGVVGMDWSPASWSDALKSGQAERVYVPAFSLDTLSQRLGAPDFVKVDTEGHEAAVVSGARALMRQIRPSWLIEFHSPENHRACETLLRRYGYEIEVVRHPHYRPGSPLYYQHGWLRAVHPDGPARPAAAPPATGPTPR